MHRILNSTSRTGRLLMLLLALAVIGVPNLVITSRHITYAAGPGDVPAGQLVRRSLVGTISSLSGSSMTISTPHGAVSVGIGGAQVNAPPDKDVGTSALEVGQKVVVNLNRSPVNPDKLKEDKDDDDPEDESGTATTTSDGSGSTVQPSDGGGTATTTQSAATSTQESADTGSGGTATSTDETIGQATESEPSTTTQEEVGQTSTDESPTATSSDETVSDGQSGTTGSTTTAEQTTATTTQTTAGSEGESSTSTSSSSTSTAPVATSTDDEIADDDGGSAAPGQVVFRSVEATVIIILPGKPTRSHQRAVCIGDTDEVELDDSIADDGTSASSTVEVESNATTTDSTDDSDGPKLKSNQCKQNGDGIVLLVKKKNRGSNKVDIVKGQRADKVEERLARILDKVRGPGKEKLAERVQQQFDRSDEKKARQVQKAEKRVVVKAQQAQERAEKAEKDRQGGGGQTDGNKGGSNQGGGNSGGGSQGSGSSGASSGGGNQGGGNQGGGPPVKDKGKGKK